MIAWLKEASVRAVGYRENGPLRLAFTPRRQRRRGEIRSKWTPTAPTLLPGSPDELLHEDECELEAVAKVLEV